MSIVPPQAHSTYYQVVAGSGAHGTSPRRALPNSAVASGRPDFDLGGASSVRNRHRIGQKRSVLRISANLHGSGGRKSLKTSQSVTKRHFETIAAAKPLRNSQSSRRLIVDHSRKSQRVGLIDRRNCADHGQFQQNTALYCAASRPNPARRSLNHAAKPLKTLNAGQAALQRLRSDA